MEYETTLLIQFPETKALLTSLEKKGPLHLAWVPMGKHHCGAFWSEEERLIGLNSLKTWRNGERLFSLLFEMHNALTSDAMAQFDLLAKQNKISKEDYVTAIEKIEYDNTWNAVALIKRGVQAGYFPSGIEIPVYLAFKDHLQLQKQSGHSALIAEVYDDLSKSTR